VVVEGVQTPEEAVEKMERRQMVHRALERLKDKDREALSLFYLQDRSYAEDGSPSLALPPLEICAKAIGAVPNWQTREQAGVCLLRRWGRLSADQRRRAGEDEHVAVRRAAGKK
jgi:hypothetical protein